MLLYIWFIPIEAKSGGLYPQGGQVEMNARSMKRQDKQMQGKTDWKKLKALSEEELLDSAESDRDAQPLTHTELKKFNRVHPLKKVNVKKIRNNLDLSQEEFAYYFGVSIRTIQEWEQGRRKPTLTARNFLKVIALEPRAVLKALASQRSF